MSSKKISRRDFLKLGATVTGASAYLAACAPQAAEPAAADLPDLTSGNSIPLDESDRCCTRPKVN